VSENLALFESYGDYKLGLEYLDKVEQLTAEDVQKAARRYLSLENTSIIEYRPNGDDDAGLNSTIIREQIASGLSLIPPAKERTEGKKDEIKLPKSQEKRESSDSKSLPVKKEVLSGGAKLVTKVNQSVPLVSVGNYFKGGRINETKENSGITQLALKGSLKGTATKNGGEIFNQLERLGATLETEAEADYFGYQMKILSENLDEGMGILADVIANPVFDQAELDKEKEILVAQIEKNKDNMADYPVELFYQAAFPHHPYGLNSLGNKDAIRDLDREKVIQWHRQNLSADNMLIVVVGDFDSSRLKIRLEDWFGNFEHAGYKKTIQPRLELEPKANVVVESRSKAQTAQALGFITCPYTNNDLYALKVLQGVASGGGGRFYGELREKRGLAYTVYGVNDSWVKAGVFYSYIATSPENEEPAREELTRQFYRFKTDTVTDEELETAQKYITGMYQIQLEANSALLKQYTKTELLGGGAEEVENYPLRINNVTKDQIRGVAERYFLPENLTVGMVKGKK
jgi:zinc protease